MVPALLGHIKERAVGLKEWGLPTPKELSASCVRKREADRLRLDRLAAPFKTNLQLERLTSKTATGPFRFAVLGDAEPGRFWWARTMFNRPGVFEEQLGRIQLLDVDFTMQLGDMVSRGIRRNYLRFFRQLHRVSPRIPYLTTIGNHDRRFPHGISDSRLYRGLFGATNYHFDHGGARFVVLDTSTHRVLRRQFDWLDRVLRFPGPKAVFTHIPPSTLRAWTDFGGARGLGGFKKGAAELTDLLSRRKVDRVYLGHIHGFGVQDMGGVGYVLSGGGGSPLFPSGVGDRFHHFLSVEAGPRGFSETVHLTDGRKMSVPSAPVLLSRAV